MHILARRACQRNCRSECAVVDVNAFFFIAKMVLWLGLGSNYTEDLLQGPSRV